MKINYNNSNIRESNYELLRVIAIFMVILLHFDKYYNNFILAYIFIATLIIFTICVVAEFIRRIVFKIIVNNKYFKTLYSKINEKYNLESRLELIVD